MLDRAMYKAYKAYWDMKTRLMNMENDENSEDGMQTVEVVLIVAIGVVIAALIVNFLTKGGFTDVDGNECGLVQYVFSEVKDKLNTIFGSDGV